MMNKNTEQEKVLNEKETIPASELWLYENPEALASVKQGLQETAEGKLTKVNLDEL